MIQHQKLRLKILTNTNLNIICTVSKDWTVHQLYPHITALYHEVTEEQDNAKDNLELVSLKKDTYFIPKSQIVSEIFLDGDQIFGTFQPNVKNKKVMTQKKINKSEDQPKPEKKTNNKKSNGQKRREKKTNKNQSKVQKQIMKDIQNKDHQNGEKGEQKEKKIRIIQKKKEKEAEKQQQKEDNKLKNKSKSKNKKQKASKEHKKFQINSLDLMNVWKSIQNKQKEQESQKVSQIDESDRQNKLKFRIDD